MVDAETPARKKRSWDIYNQDAANYDAWFDTPRGAAIFAAEFDALQPLTAGLPRPWLEVGVGTGRFAAALGIDVGVDPAFLALKLAHHRGITTIAAVGEALPFRSNSFGAVVINVTLCFVEDPQSVLHEVHRVLKPEGCLVVGLVPSESSWGRRYQQRATEGHPYYSAAHFIRLPEFFALLSTAGLQLLRSRSTLFWPPNSEPRVQTVRDGASPSAGFVAMLAAKASAHPNTLSEYLGGPVRRAMK